MKTIRIKTRNVYGNELMYSVDYVHELEQLTGKKTLSNSNIASLKAMGFEVILLDKLVDVMAN